MAGKRRETQPPISGKERLKAVAEILARGIVRLAEKEHLERTGKPLRKPLDFQPEGSVCAAPTKKEKAK
jgi:hypothetical protein